jgi:23S rRNA G2069 N7-methylase RlmK/C1962 C5-methylase RlmI
MTNKYSRVILKSGKEQSLQRFHPWIFSGAIHEIDGRVEEGDVLKYSQAKKNFWRWVIVKSDLLLSAFFRSKK